MSTKIISGGDEFKNFFPETIMVQSIFFDF